MDVLRGRQPLISHSGAADSRTSHGPRDGPSTNGLNELDGDDGFSRLHIHVVHVEEGWMVHEGAKMEAGAEEEGKLRQSRRQVEAPRKFFR